MFSNTLFSVVPARSLAYWIKTLSITGGPLEEGNFRVAITFFLQYYRDINIRTKLASLFKGIDWHQPVMLRSCATETICSAAARRAAPPGAFSPNP